MVLYFQPNQLIDKYWQMVGGSYTVVTNHKKCWLGLKMCLCFNLYVLIRRITHTIKSMKFYMYYFCDLLNLWNSMSSIFCFCKYCGLKMWQNECVEPLNISISILKPCRFNKHLEFTRDVKWVIFFLFFSFVDSIIHLINQIFLFIICKVKGKNH